MENQSSSGVQSDLIEALKNADRLHLLTPQYVNWEVGDDGVTLDGYFSIEELEALVGHIKRINKRESNG